MKNQKLIAYFLLFIFSKKWVILNALFGVETVYKYRLFYLDDIDEFVLTMRLARKKKDFIIRRIISIWVIFAEDDYPVGSFRFAACLEENLRK